MSVTVSAGVTSSGLVLSNADVVEVLAGGTTLGTFLDHGGTEIVSGTVVSTMDGHGGQEVVFSGGTARFSLLSGGFQRVLSGGVATGTVQDSLGFLLVSSGGTAIAADLNMDSVDIVSWGGVSLSATVHAGADLALLGGVASGATAAGGLITVGQGATYAGPDVSPVLHGGTDIGAFVLSGGEELVEAGGLASATTIANGGEEVIASGGIARDVTIGSGGLAVFSSGAVGSGITVASGGSLLLLPGSEVTGIVSGGSLLSTGIATVQGETVSSLAGGSLSPISVGSGESASVQSGGSESGVTVTSGGTESSVGWSLYGQSNESYFVPYASASFGSAGAADPTIQISLSDGGSTVFTGDGHLDTGSRGITISQASVPTITQGANDPSGSLFYWSSGILRLGYWHQLSVTFDQATASAEGMGAATAKVWVLVVQEEVQLAGDWPNGTREQTFVSAPGVGVGLIGIGFDRTGDGDTPENSAFNQNLNPLLNVAQMQSGAMTAGFIITTSGLQLGLTAANTSAGANGGSGTFSYEKLLPTPFSAVSGSPADWQAPTGSVVYNGGSASPVGQVVLDTGINNALLTLSGNPAQPADPSEATTVAPGTTITTHLLGTSGGVSYTYVAGDTSNPMAPTATTWSAIQSGNQNFSENVSQSTLANTGVDAFNGFNYLYDAQNGYLGLQLNGNAAAASAGVATDDPVTVYQGTTTLQDTFSSTYPVALVDDFDTQASVGFIVAGTATLAGDITGGADTLTGTAQPITLNLLGGTLHLTGDNDYAAVAVQSGATLDLGSDDAGGGHAILFTPGAMLIVDSGIQPRETLTGLGAGDRIDFLGLSSATVQASGETLVVSGTQGQVTLQLDAPLAEAVTTGVDEAGTGTLLTIACFAAGTRIATPEGPVAVEALQPGQRVMTLDGPAAITWLGRRRVDCARHPAPGSVRPVRIAPHSFGPGRPARPLLLSPDHAVYAEGVLIPVKHLIDGAMIRQIDLPQITYHHIELARHGVVFAEGLPTESYLETGDRSGFEGRVVDLHPAWGSAARDIGLVYEASAYAPLRVTGAEVARVREGVRRAQEAARAAAGDRGRTEFTAAGARNC